MIHKLPYTHRDQPRDLYLGWAGEGKTHLIESDSVHCHRTKPSGTEQGTVAVGGGSGGLEQLGVSGNGYTQADCPLPSLGLAC